VEKNRHGCKIVLFIPHFAILHIKEVLMKTTSLSLLMSGMFLLAACQNRMVTPVETTTPQMTDTLPMLATATAVVPETAEPVAWEIEVVA